MLDKKTFVPHLQRLLERYPGASFELAVGKRHDRVYLNYCDKRRFVTISCTSTDPRTLKNRLRDVRHTLHQMEN